MKVDGKPYRTIWLGADGTTVQAIDQTLLPHAFVVRDFTTMEDAERAIRTMIVRGAPLIGAAAAYGMALAMAADPSDAMLARAYQVLLAARPTAVNLRWALDDLQRPARPLPPARRREAAYRRAAEICDEDAEICRRIGEHGLGEIRRAEAARRSPQCPYPLQRRLARHRRLGHGAGADLPGARRRHSHPCLGRRNAAAQPGRQPDGLGARQARRAAHRDRRQCRRPPDAARRVDFCITGTDRTTRRGDVCNKIGTYLKALAARDNGVPFYVGLPSPSIDWTIADGLATSRSRSVCRRGLAHHRAGPPRARS